MALGDIVKFAAIGVGIVAGYRYIARPWLARRAARKLVVIKGKLPASERNLKVAMASVVNKLVALKVQADVSPGTYSGVAAVTVKPANRGLVGRLRELLPDEISGTPIVVV